MRAVTVLGCVAVLLFGLLAVPAVAAPAGCEPAQVRPGASPIVLVHGWNSSAAGMSGLDGALTRATLGPGYQILPFDYSSSSNLWPSDGAASCLGRYLVRAARVSGRKAIVVAHSMGGIATRFAATQSFDGMPVSAALADLITLGTPHHGSPWGGTAAAGVLQGFHELVDLVRWPSNGNAALCLATKPAASCGIPPYLPTGVGVDQIGTQITFNRTLFDLPIVGKKQADYPLYGDGVVPQDSALGYPGSGPAGERTPRAHTTAKTVACTINADYAMAQKFGARLGSRAGGPGAIIGGELATLGNVLLDGAALDDMQAGRISPALLELSGYAYFSDCFHTNLTTQREVVDATVAAIKAVDTTPATATKSVTLRPVSGAGKPATGWTVQDDDLLISCGYASPVAVDSGIHDCGPGASYAIACWPSQEGTALCLTDAWGRVLTRFPATDIDKAVRPNGAAQPMALELAGGTRCRIRNGGAWPDRPDNPDLTGAYSCSEHDDQIVWAPRSGAINESALQWTVQLGTDTSPLRTVGVTTAYTVGSA